MSVSDEVEVIMEKSHDLSADGDVLFSCVVFTPKNDRQCTDERLDGTRPNFEDI